MPMGGGCGGRLVGRILLSLIVLGCAPLEVFARATVASLESRPPPQNVEGISRARPTSAVALLETMERTTEPITIASISIGALLKGVLAVGKFLLRLRTEMGEAGARIHKLVSAVRKSDEVIKSAFQKVAFSAVLPDLSNHLLDVAVSVAAVEKVFGPVLDSEADPATLVRRFKFRGHSKVLDSLEMHLDHANEALAKAVAGALALLEGKKLSDDTDEFFRPGEEPFGRAEMARAMDAAGPSTAEAPDDEAVASQAAAVLAESIEPAVTGILRGLVVVNNALGAVVSRGIETREDLQAARRVSAVGSEVRNILVAAVRAVVGPKPDGSESRLLGALGMVQATLKVRGGDPRQRYLVLATAMEEAESQFLSQAAELTARIGKAGDLIKGMAPISDRVSSALKHLAGSAQRTFASVLASTAKSWESIAKGVASPSGGPPLSESLRRILRQIVSDGRSCRASARFAFNKCADAYRVATQRCVHTRWFVVNSFKYALGAHDRSLTERMCTTRNRSPLMHHVMSAFARDGRTPALPPDAYSMNGVEPVYQYACLERLMLPFVKNSEDDGRPKEFFELASAYIEKEPSIYTSAKGAVNALKLLTSKRSRMGKSDAVGELYRLLYSILLNIGTLNLYIARMAFPLDIDLEAAESADSEIDGSIDCSHPRADSRRLQYFTDAIVDIIGESDLRRLRGTIANNIEANRGAADAADGESVLGEYEVFKGYEGMDRSPVNYASISLLYRNIYDLLHDSKSRAFLNRKLGEAMVGRIEEEVSGILTERIVLLDASKEKLRDFVLAAPAARMSECTSEISRAASGCAFLTQKLSEKCGGSRLGKELGAKLAKAHMSGDPVHALTSAFDDGHEEDSGGSGDHTEREPTADESRFGRYVLTHLFASMRHGLVSELYSSPGDIATVLRGPDTSEGDSRAFEDSTVPALDVRVAAMASSDSLGPDHPCIAVLSLMKESHPCFRDVAEYCRTEVKVPPTNLSCATLLSDLPLLLKALAPRDAESLPPVYYVREYLQLYSQLDGTSRLQAMSFIGWRSLLGLASSFGEARASEGTGMQSLFDYISSTKCKITPLSDSPLGVSSMVVGFESVECDPGESYLVKRLRVVNEDDAARVKREVVANERLNGAAYVLPYHGYFFSRSGPYMVGIVFSPPPPSFTTLAKFIENNPNALRQSGTVFRQVALHVMSIALSMETKHVYHMNIGCQTLFIHTDESRNMKMLVSSFEHAITREGRVADPLPRYFVSSTENMPPDALHRAIVASGTEDPDAVSSTDKLLLGESYQDPYDAHLSLAAWNTWSVGATLVAVLKADPVWQRTDADAAISICKDQQRSKSAASCDYAAFMSLLGLEYEVSFGRSYATHAVLAVAESNSGHWSVSDVSKGANFLSRLLQIPYFARPDLEVFIHHPFLQGPGHTSALPAYARVWENCAVKQDSGDVHDYNCLKKTPFPVFPLVSKTSLVYKSVGWHTLKISFSVQKGYEDVLVIPKVEDDLGGVTDTNGKFVDLCPASIVNADADGIVEAMKILNSGVCSPQSEVTVSVPMLGSVVAPASPLRVRLVYFSKKTGLSTHYDVFFLPGVHVVGHMRTGLAVRLYEYTPSLGHRQWEERSLNHRNQRKICQNFMSVMLQSYLLPATKDQFPMKLLPPSLEQTELALMFRGLTASQRRDLLHFGPIGACMVLDGFIPQNVHMLNAAQLRGARARYLMPRSLHPLKIEEGDRLLSEFRDLQNCAFGPRSYRDDPAVLKRKMNDELCLMCKDAVKSVKSILNTAKSMPSTHRVVFPPMCEIYEKMADSGGLGEILSLQDVSTMNICTSLWSRTKALMCHGIGRYASRVLFGRALESESPDDVDICKGLCTADA